MFAAIKCCARKIFNQLKYVKSNLRSSLLLQSLNALLRIRVTGCSSQITHKQQANDFWFKSKERRMHQHKKKKERVGQIANPKRACFDVNELYSPSPSSSLTDSEDD